MCYSPVLFHRKDTEGAEFQFFLLSAEMAESKKNCLPGTWIPRYYFAITSTGLLFFRSVAAKRFSIAVYQSRPVWRGLSTAMEKNSSLRS
jgi:hypothetical protein